MVSYYSFALLLTSCLAVVPGYHHDALPGTPDRRPIPGDSPIVQCDVKDKQLLDLKRVVISPNPPERGQNLTITAEGTLAKDIVDGAYVDVDVRYGFIKLVSDTFDLCKESTKVDLECPIKKGSQTLTKEVAIPNEVPPGKYLVVARAYTKDDEFITCLTAEVEFPQYGAYDAEREEAEEIEFVIQQQQ